MCLQIALYSLFGQPSFCSIFILSKSKDFHKVVSRIWMQLPFFANALFLTSGDSLGLKHVASPCKRIAFAAEVQKKPKRCRAFKVAKGPYIWFKLSLSLRCFSSRISVKYIRHVDSSHSRIAMATYFPVTECDSGSKSNFLKKYL